ncbi:MAG: LysR family transcriptional regulator [Rubritepida sp.]|nr:LysR family transcriptional regulator [Rubritepida sp.]
MLRVAPHGPFATTDSVVALQAVRKGFGLAALFLEYCEADLAAGTLESVLEDWCEPFPGPVLYYPSRRLMPAGLRAFVDLIRAG